jgi:RNA polymerase sigma-70 factor (ECF subfamily)
MDTTSASLIHRLRDGDNQAAWRKFVDLYTPLLFYWARKSGLQEQDAADLVQEVFALLFVKLPEFEYRPQEQRSGRFRAWLRTVTLNKWKERRRKRQAEALEPADPRWSEPTVPDDAEAFWRDEYDQFLVARALTNMQAQFQPTSWQACWETTVNGRAAADVAAELGLSEGAVFVAKSRVLRKLRQELAGLLDE